MLQEAYNLLEEEYKKCLAYVQKNKYFAIFAQEKKRHSFQVMGAGNYLIRHIKWLQNQSAEYIETVQTAIFLHDICRFTEITKLYDGISGYDHGEEGAKFLQSIPMFSDIRIWLPIKHHGHLIKELYADPEYQNIEDADIKQQVQKICFIIRDADKIANLNMLTHEKNVWFLFLGKDGAEYNPSVDGIISDIIRKEAFEDITVSRSHRTTVADRYVSYISWFTDINYQAAIDYCNCLNIVSLLVQLFNMYCSDEDFKQRYLSHFQNYLSTRQYLL